MIFLDGGPADLTVTDDGTYQTVDLTSDIPAADQGNVEIAMISTFNPDVGDNLVSAVRAVGATDDLVGQQLDAGGRTFWFVKVDSNDQIEIKLESTAQTWEVRFWGYFTADEAVGFVNPSAQDYTPVSTATWTDADISGDTGADTALAAIVLMEAHTNASISAAGVRVNGSTDEVIPGFARPGAGNVIFHVIGVDENEIFEAYIQDGGIVVYLAGYVKDNFTAFTNMVDVSGASTGVYEDIDVSASVPSGNTFISGLVDHGANSNRHSGLRQNGWTVDEQGSCSRQAGFCMGIDGDRILEHNRDNSSIVLYLRGYGAEPAAAATAKPLVANRMLTGVG